MNPDKPQSVHHTTPKSSPPLGRAQQRRTVEDADPRQRPERRHFSFGPGTEFHQENARIVREAAKRAVEIAIVADRHRPKIPRGQIAGGDIELNKGETLLLDAAAEARHAPGGRFGLPRPARWHCRRRCLVAGQRHADLTVESVRRQQIITGVENSHVWKQQRASTNAAAVCPQARWPKDFRDLRSRDCHRLRLPRHQLWNPPKICISAQSRRNEKAFGRAPGLVSNRT